MQIFKTDRGIGMFVAYSLLAVIAAAVGTSLTGSFRVAILAALAFVFIMTARYECYEWLQRYPRNLGLRALVATLSVALMYGLYLVFQVIHGEGVEPMPSLPWLALFAFIAGTALLVPPDWRLRKKSK